MRFRGTSSPNLPQSCRLSATWQPVQFKPSEKPHRVHELIDGDAFQDLNVLEKILGHERLVGRRGLRDQRRDHEQARYGSAQIQRRLTRFGLQRFVSLW